jgi:hypothetical protein
MDSRLSPLRIDFFDPGPAAEQSRRFDGKERRLEIFQPFVEVDWARTTVLP